MEPYFNKDEMTKLLEDFYLLTKIRITVFDDSFEEIMSYPNHKCEICQYMRKNRDFDFCCRICDKEHMKKAAAIKETIIYPCHAGLTEIISPLFYEGNIIGYLFFSHILNYRTHQEAEEEILKKVEKYHFETEHIQKGIERMPLFEDDYLRAASRVLEETASYLIQKKYAYLRARPLTEQIDNYINTHIQDDLKIETLAEIFSVSKSTINHVMNDYYKAGIQKHIRRLRMEKAANLLLENPEMKISTAAMEVGIYDSSYFIIMFKKEMGMTPNDYRKKHINP